MMTRTMIMIARLPLSLQFSSLILMKRNGTINPITWADQEASLASLLLTSTTTQMPVRENRNYLWNLLALYVQGVPKKTLVSVQRLLEVFKNDLQIKVGWVLKNSENFQSNEHRNFVFLPKIAWDIKAQSWLPLP